MSAAAVCDTRQGSSSLTSEELPVRQERLDRVAEKAQAVSQKARAHKEDGGIRLKKLSPDRIV